MLKIHEVSYDEILCQCKLTDEKGNFLRSSLSYIESVQLIRDTLDAGLLEATVLLEGIAPRSENNSQEQRAIRRIKLSSVIALLN